MPKSVIEARFDMHEDQCKADKLEIKGRLDSIDNKLWALIVAAVVYLLGTLGYIVTQGTPWEQTQTIVADRGEK